MTNAEKMARRTLFSLHAMQAVAEVFHRIADGVLRGTALWVLHHVGVNHDCERAIKTVRDLGPGTTQLSFERRRGRAYLERVLVVAPPGWARPHGEWHTGPLLAQAGETLTLEFGFDVLEKMRKQWPSLIAAAPPSVVWPLVDPDYPEGYALNLSPRDARRVCSELRHGLDVWSEEIERTPFEDEKRSWREVRDSLFRVGEQLDKIAREGGLGLARPWYQKQD